MNFLFLVKILHECEVKSMSIFKNYKYILIQSHHRLFICIYKYYNICVFYTKKSHILEYFISLYFTILYPRKFAYFYSVRT